MPLRAGLTIDWIGLLLVEVHFDRLAHLLARSTIAEHLHLRCQLGLKRMQIPLLLVSLSALPGLDVEQTFGRNPRGLDLLLKTLVLNDCDAATLLLASQVAARHSRVHLLLARSALDLLLLTRRT